MATTPMFSPDGTLGDIPNERVADAQKAGFKVGNDMLAPDGTPGVVPFDRVAEAVKGGFKPRGFSSMQAESPIPYPTVGNNFFPAVQKPTIPMSQVYLNTGNPVPPPQTWRDVVSGATRNMLQMSTPGMAISAINQRFPNAPIPQAVKDLATPMKQLPQQMVTNMVPVIAGGMDEPSPSIQPSTRPTVASGTQLSPTGSSIASVVARHIPVVGKVLRTIDDVQELLGKDAPHPTSMNNVAPAKAPVPETNGIQWGTGGQGPLDLRGKMIPGTQVPSNYQNIPLGNITPAKTSTVDPYREQLLPKMTPGRSTAIEAHAYDPNSNTMYTHFKSGDILKYKGVPQEVYNQFENAPSQNAFHRDNIQGRYQTDRVGKVAPTRGARVSSALQRGSQ